jgi:hypothetical protein
LARRRWRKMYGYCIVHNSNFQGFAGVQKGAFNAREGS